MNEILTINYESENPTVSARELHEKLNIKTALGLRKIFSAIPNLFEQFWRKPFLYQRN